MLQETRPALDQKSPHIWEVIPAQCIFIFLSGLVDNEKRLAAKCKQLNEDLTGASARVTAALRLSEEDQLTIAALRKELEKYWKQIDTTHDKAQSSFKIAEKSYSTTEIFQKMQCWLFIDPMTINIAFV